MEMYGQVSSTGLELAKHMLEDLRFSFAMKGTQYVLEALELAARRPELGSSLRCRLYPYLAQKHQTTSACVERNIRYAIEAAWNRCNPQTAEHYFGYTTDPDKGKPTNRELITTLALQIAVRSIPKNDGA